MKRVLLGICIVLCLGTGFPKQSAGQTTGGDKVTSQILPGSESKEPVVITGDSFEFDTAKKIATYVGNAKVIQGETSMFADQLVIYLGQTGGQFEKAVATGNVRLASKDITATGDQGTIYNAEQKLDLEGKAKAWQENNTITAHRLVVFFKEGILEGYGDPSTERAKMTVYSQKTNPTLEPTTPTPAPQRPETPKEQDSAPVVIESDLLKLDNPNQKGTFTGNVIVTQGLTQINADEMNVSVRKTQEMKDDIEKIEVSGNVRIVKENMTITGDKGQYINSEQYARVDGTPPKKARAEDKAQNLTLEAPTIEIFLATNTIRGKGGPVRTSLGTSENTGPAAPGQPTATPTAKPKSENTGPAAPGQPTATPTAKPRDDLPSAIIFPKKK